MSKTVFIENQRFNQWWIWILLLMAMGVTIGSTLKTYNGNHSDLLIPAITFSLIIILFVSIRLKTRIDEQGVHVQMFPFHLKSVTYKWEDLYSAEAVTYSPIGDYGGWGVRISFRGKGKAFNIRGDQGIKLVTNDGKTRMIGTQNEKEAQGVIAYYKAEAK